MKTGCYCSNTAPTEPATDCDVPCRGNSDVACGGSRSITAFEFDTVPTPAPVEQLGYDVVGCFVDDGSENGQNRVLSGENVKKQPALTTQVSEDEDGDNFSCRVCLAHTELFPFSSRFKKRDHAAH